MNRQWILSLVVMLPLGLHACASIDVKTDYDPEADFTTFKSFAFAGLTETNKGGIFDNSLTRKRIESAVGRELTGKGLRQVGLDQHPDLLVHYWIGIQEKQRVETTGPAGGYGWRGGYGPAPGYSTVRTYEYKEGTLILDLVEPARNELVWRAKMVANLEDATQENVELAHKAIAKAFEQYPPTKTVR